MRNGFVRSGTIVAIAAAALLATGAQAQPAKPPMSDQFRRTIARVSAEWQARMASGQVPATVVEPSVTSAKILTPMVDVTKAPGLPQVQLSLASGTIGVSYMQIMLTSPSGSHTLFAEASLPPYPPEPAHENIKIQLTPSFGGAGPLGLYAEPGKWSVTEIVLFTNANAFITYYGGAVAALFPAGAVVNVINPGTPDLAPPVVAEGAILTPTVSLSGANPQVVVRLQVSDSVSGVTSASVSLSGPPGSSGFPSQLYVSRNLLAPTATTDAYLSQQLSGSTLPPGTYTISDIYTCDAANNCTDINTASGIAAHFGRKSVTLTK